MGIDAGFDSEIVSPISPAYGGVARGNDEVTTKNPYSQVIFGTYSRHRYHR